MFNFPRYLILPDKVYSLIIHHQSDVGRAITKDLIDYLVEVKNPLEPADSKKVFLGISKAFVQGYRGPIRLEWLLGRFLCDHLRTNSIHLLEGPDGAFLHFKNYKKYLGEEVSFPEVQETVGRLLQSWVRTFPHESPSWQDIFVSSINIPEEKLKTVFDSLK